MEFILAAVVLSFWILLSVGSFLTRSFIDKNRELLVRREVTCREF